MMRVVVHFVCCLLFGCMALAQNGIPSSQDLLIRGRQLYLQNGPKAALPELESALQQLRAKNDRHGEAVALGYIANCYRKLENLDKALEFAQEALRIKQSLGDSDEIGETHNQLGLIYWHRADYAVASQHFRTAIEIAGSVPDKQLEGKAHNNLGLVLDEQGDYRQSLVQYQKALALHRATHFERGESDTLGNIGGVYLLEGRFTEALPYYEQASAIDEHLGLKPALSLDLGNIALCLSSTGDIDGALKTFDRALAVAHEAGLAKDEADWHKGKGTTLAGLGRFDAALLEYAAAERVYEKAGLRRELAEALLDSGQVDELLGDGISAESRFRRALALARKIGNASGENASLLDLGELERRRRRYDTAGADFLLASQRARRIGNENIVVSCMIQSALNDLDRKRYESALKNAADAIQLAEQGDNRPAMANAHYVIAEVYRTQRQFQPALDEYSSAESIQKQLRDPEMKWRILYGRGQALAAMGKTDDAIASYESAVRVIEDTRSAIAEERYRAGYMEDRYQVYVALVELFLKLHRNDDAFVYSEKLRARAYFDQLGSNVPPGTGRADQQRLRELGERIRTLRHALENEYQAPQAQRREQAVQVYSDELATAEREYAGLLDRNHDTATGVQSGGRLAILSTSEIQQRLPSTAALVEYVVGREDVSILLITPSAVRGFSVPVTAESLSSRTELLRDLIAERRPEWVLPARALRQLLIDPLIRTEAMRGIRELVIVPDGVLNYVPYAALPLGPQRFLGDGFVITYLPAASALIRNPKNEGRSLLAMAPSDTHLPYAIAEVRGIGQIFGPEAHVVVGTRATKTLFKQIAGEYDFLHLATHGSLNRSAPSLSALQLESDRDNDGRLELYEIAGLQLHARLITLSACETGLGTGYFTETPAGDEFVGLTRAFLGAGAENVLASLWAVNDESTEYLMIRFYRNLLTANGPEALAKAQQQLRHDYPQYRRPYYWAPFVLSGPIN